MLHLNQYLYILPIYIACTVILNLIILWLIGVLRKEDYITPKVETLTTNTTQTEVRITYSIFIKGKYMIVDVTVEGVHVRRVHASIDKIEGVIKQLSHYLEVYHDIKPDTLFIKTSKQYL